MFWPDTKDKFSIIIELVFKRFWHFVCSFSIFMMTPYNFVNKNVVFYMFYIITFIDMLSVFIWRNHILNDKLMYIKITKITPYIKPLKLLMEKFGQWQSLSLKFLNQLMIEHVSKTLGTDIMHSSLASASLRI